MRPSTWALALHQVKLEVIYVEKKKEKFDKGWGHGLRDVWVRVPEAVSIGQRAVLICSYDLEGDPLYTVKWYKGGREFYRFTPKEDPPVKIFPTHGISSATIDKESSNSSQVVVTEVSSRMSGQYSCEISADAPSFHTALVSALMRVVEMPRGRPKISGIRGRYSLGETLYGNCTSPPSRPSTNLTWSIGGRIVSKQHIKHYMTVDGEDHEISMSIVELPLTRPRFSEGRFKLKCTATLYNVYWENAEKSADIYNYIFEDFNWQNTYSPQRFDQG